MAPKSAHFLLAFLSLLAVAAPIYAAGRGSMVGGWKPIDNPSARGIVEIAKFAVAEHNKEEKKSLVFVSVVKGETQVVAGLNYKLVISAKDGGPAAAPKNYTAIVYSKAGTKSLQLTSFVQN